VDELNSVTWTYDVKINVNIVVICISHKRTTKMIVEQVNCLSYLGCLITEDFVNRRVEVK